MKEEISKILVKWDMPTRQVAINEIVAFAKSLFGGCQLCYGKGYSTYAVQYKNEGTGEAWPGKELLFCKCSRGKDLEKIIVEKYEHN